MRGLQLPGSFFINNRRELIKQMEADSLGLILSAEQFPRNADLLHPFRQDSNFFYLTGIEAPNCTLLLIPHNHAQPEEILFIPPVNPEKVKWEGQMLTPEQAQKISGIKQVRSSEDLLLTLFRVQHWRSSLYCELNPTFPAQPLSAGQQLLRNLTDRIPGLALKKLHFLTTSLRSKKKPEEIKLIQTAVDITEQALRKVMAVLKPGMMEYQVEAELVYHYLKSGCDRLGYEIIAASGVNATILHYTANKDKIKANELILIDTGGEFGMYSADITRCFPASGRFNKKQRKFYQAVLDVNQQFIAELAPGKSWKELYLLADKILGETYASYGFIQKPKDHPKISLHRIGHSLGLDIHDVNRLETPLEEGAVITVEPGLYLPEQKIGLRIEDNILLTKNGCQNISANIPTEINEIEHIMNNGE